ncbi:hypothetical protein EHQ96_06710 [Leptospira levettii]|uniref:hypothetical protein n=1 Tax=Leptospira levettii TaxID=2023178 RepID=UPI001082FAAA|nr:hypothetical protein [Leptospira levettii]TGM69223.1 hypothetical protein EHQ96_06710 [Leptospira levettii]TGM76059.1 hypothetical protein EHR04_10955 [Leptospira levettii]
MFKQISFLKILTLFSLTFETLFLIDLCYLDDIEVKGSVQYISFSKDRETCFASLKNIQPIHEPAFYLVANELEKEFLVDGNKEICQEFRRSDEISSLYLYFSKIFNHPTEVEIITQKADHYYETPYLKNYQFVLLHSFFLVMIFIQMLGFKFRYPKTISIFLYIVLIYISIAGYFEIERKVKFHFLGEKLEFEIVESK